MSDNVFLKKTALQAMNENETLLNKRLLQELEGIRATKWNGQIKSHNEPKIQANSLFIHTHSQCSRSILFIFESYFILYYDYHNSKGKRDWLPTTFHFYPSRKVFQSLIFTKQSNDHVKHIPRIKTIKRSFENNTDSWNYFDIKTCTLNSSLGEFLKEQRDIDSTESERVLERVTDTLLFRFGG